MPSALSILGEEPTKPTALSVLGEASKRKTRTQPGIGATVGGLAGGLLGKAGGYAGAVGGAAAGGAAGEAVQQALENPARLVGLAPMDFSQLGLAGAEQGGYEAAGGLIGKGLKVGANAGMRIALKVTPEVAQTALREGITATKAGLGKLMTRIGEAAQAERKIIAAASAQGIGWKDPHALTQAAFDKAAAKLEGAPQNELGRLADLQREFLKDNPQAINPLNLLKKRQYYDTASSEARKAVGGGAKPKLDPVRLWNQAMGDEIRQALRADIPAITDPSAYAKITGKPTTPAELQMLKEAAFPAVRRAGGVLEKAASAAGRPALGAAIGAALPGNRPRHAIEGAAAGMVLHPAILSHLALRAQTPALEFLLTQALRGGGLASKQQTE